MKINSNFTGKDTFEKIGRLSLIAEHHMKTLIQGVPGNPVFDFMCTPSELTELIAGRLCSEGFIRSKSEIESIYVSEDGENSSVALIPNAKRSAHGYEIQRLSCPQYSDEWIYSLAGRFSEATPLFIETHSAHSAFLAIKDEILYISEDLGRHNALDKVIGHAVLNGINLKDTILYTSGRVPTDMALKAIRSGIPILVSKAYATCSSISLAKKYGLTILQKTRPDSFFRI